MSTLRVPLIDAEYERFENAAAVKDTDQDKDDSPNTLELVAPATLLEGYELIVDVDGKSLTVVVPPGGVKKGQKFTASLAPPACGEVVCKHHATVGHWRDGLYDCCQHGCFHPLFCTAYWCLPVVIAQVLYRLKLNWCGRPSTHASAEAAFCIIVGGSITFFVVRNALLFVVSHALAVLNDPSHQTNEEVHKTLLLVKIQNFVNILYLAFTCYMVVLMIRARRFIRRKDAIPAKDCGKYEDCCCSLWCTFCAISQMARHTADYEVHAVACCSRTGLSSHIPETV